MERGPERARGTAAGSSAIDAVNLHHSEWSAGTVALFHRFGRFALGWDAQHARDDRLAARHGHRRRLQRPRRPAWSTLPRAWPDAAPTRRAQRAPIRPGGHMIMNARPMIESWSIGPKTRPSLEFSRLSPMHQHLALGHGQRLVDAERRGALGQVRLLEQTTVDVEPRRPGSTSSSPGSPMTRLIRSLGSSGPPGQVVGTCEHDDVATVEVVRVVAELVDQHPVPHVEGRAPSTRRGSGTPGRRRS